MNLCLWCKKKTKNNYCGRSCINGAYRKRKRLSLISSDWKSFTEIDGFNGLYRISKDGMIFSEIVSKYMRPTIKNGYYFISLRKNGRYYGFYLHRLIATTFIPNPECKRCVNHIDGNKKNNSLQNLEWVTHSENIRHRDTVLGYVYPIEKLKHNLSIARKNNDIRGSKHPLSKLSEEEAKQIYSLSMVLDAVSIAKRYGISPSTVKAIKSKKLWSFIHD